MSKEQESAPAVFLDRDGTINVDRVEYVTEPGQMELIEGVGQALRRLQAGGYRLVVITNQACLAKGLVDKAGLKKVHDKMESLLAEEGVSLDGIYFCGDHPEGSVEQYAKESERRKPQPGMLLEAARDLDIDLSKSWMVGDKTRDAEAGKGAGCRTILLNDLEQQEKGGNEPPDPEAADFIAANLLEAAEVIIREDMGEGGQTEGLRPKRAMRDRDEAVGSRRLLSDILRELRHQRVSQRHREFSVTEMLAGMAQVGVFLCLVFAYAAFSHWSGEALFASLTMGLILQMMVISLLLTRR